MQWVEELKSVYKSIEDVDYLTGCLAESPRPKGYVISNTAFYVFIMNASRRILCDRFYQVPSAMFARDKTLNFASLAKAKTQVLLRLQRAKA